MKSIGLCIITELFIRAPQSGDPFYPYTACPYPHPMITDDWPTVNSENQFSNVLRFKVFPNPTSDYIVVRTPSPQQGTATQKYIACLYNITGNLLRTIKISDAKTTINLQEYPPAMYYITVVLDKPGMAHSIDNNTNPNNFNTRQSLVSTVKIIKN